MELVYLWVEEYKNIKNQGFNFSPRFKCSYDDKTKELTINENKDYVNIFPENINLTAIVGENGSGKSSILESMIYIQYKENKSINGFIIFYLENVYYYIGNIKPNVNHKDTIMIKEVSSDNQNVFVWINNIYSYNIRTNSLLQVALQMSSKFDRTYSANENYVFKKHFELSKEMDLNQILDKKYYFDAYKLTMKKIRVEPDIYWREYQANENKSLYNEIDNMPTTLRQTDFIFTLINNFYIALIKFYLVNWNKLNQNTKFYNILRFSIIFTNNLLYQGVLNNEQYLEHIKNLIDDVNNLKYNDELLIEQLKYIKDTLYNSLTENVNSKNIRLDSNNQRTNTSFDKTYIFSENPNIGIYLSNIESFSNNEEDLKMFNFFSIDIINSKTKNSYSKLSNGERELLNISIDLLYAIKYCILYNKTPTFILDEADAYLHPNWSKKLIHTIIKIYNNYIKYINKSLKINLLFSTHSPFILSDLPKENVIFLKNGKQEYPFENEQTFGANIHTLLSHGFFMEDGLMGEFAKSKITEITKFYDESKELKKEDSDFQTKKDEFEKKKKDFYNIQSIIGEAFLKTVIKNYLDELEILFYGKKEFLDKEIKRLEELRKNLNDKA